MRKNAEKPSMQCVLCIDKQESKKGSKTELGRNPNEDPRMITGCYHDVSDEHLQSYIDETVYRWNTRKDNECKRFKDMFDKCIGKIVTWKNVINYGLTA